MERVRGMYDRVSKRLISLSKPQTIRLLNGLYNKNHPLDSEVEYHWTEHNDDELKRTLADTIITIIDKESNERKSYHLEIQMYKDEEIILRVFEYGYRHALTNRNGHRVLAFPNPLILYLYESGNAPDTEELEIDFGEQGSFTYCVPTFKYLKMPPEELERRQLFVLVPFQLLRLRKEIEKERTPENMAALKELISHDILNTIQRNVAVGNLSVSDGRRLKKVVLQLYHHIYDRFEELKEAGMEEMVDEALIFDIDIIEYEHKKEKEAMEQAHKNELERVRMETEAKSKKVLNDMADKLRSLGVSEEEITRLTGTSKE